MDGVRRLMDDSTNVPCVPCGHQRLYRNTRTGVYVKRRIEEYAFVWWYIVAALITAAAAIIATGVTL